MNPIEILQNYLDISKFLVILTVFLIIIVTYFLLSTDLSFIHEELIPKEQESSSPDNEASEITNESLSYSKENKEIIIRGFHQNKIKENGHKFILSEETEKVNNLSEKIIISSQKNHILSKKDELSLMFIESLSSLNSWNNNQIEKELFKKLNWNLEKRNNKEESLVFQYVYPQLNMKDYSSYNPIPNLSSSQSSINSYSETEDEEEKEKALLNTYKLGICRAFDCSNENEIKSNIVKEVNGSLYKVYSEGNPILIKEKCRKDTIPENFDEIIEKYKKSGYDVIGLSGKKMKMNYLQSQRIERNKCEMNMIFLGFVIYKVNFLGYKSEFS